MNLEVPNVWSRNYCWRRRTSPRRRPTTSPRRRWIASWAARAFSHRKVELSDDTAGERLEPGFRALGWVSEYDVIMVAGRELDRPVDTSIVEEVSLDDLGPAWTDGWKTDPAVLGAEVMSQLVEQQAPDGRGRGHEVLRGPRGRGGRELLRALVRRATAQIENVLTLSRFRKRGLARATVSKALEEARNGRHELIFLIADQRDWPKELYAKLGFDGVGRIWEFVLPRAG